MAKIKIISECPLYDGMPVTFQAPCDCTAVDGLNVYYGDGALAFGFRDAHGNDLAGTGNLFAEGAYVKAILNTATGCAYLQNADTNKYLEGMITAAQTAATNAASAAATAQSTADGKAAASHNQAASTITAGTFAGQVVANSSGQTYSTSLLRNSKLVSAETNPTVNGEICWTYE